MYIYMTLLFRGHCAIDNMEASKKIKLAGRIALFMDCSGCGCRIINSVHCCCCCLDLRSAHGSAPGVFGKGAFLGALAIEEFLETGAAFTGTVDAALDDAGACCELEDVKHRHWRLLTTLSLQLMDPCRLDSAQAVEFISHS